MGCVCGKPSPIEDSRENPPDRPLPPPVAAASYAVAPGKVSSSAVAFSSSRREEVVDAEVVEKKQGSGPVRVERRKEIVGFPVGSLRPYGGFSKGMEGECVSAGWPVWLASVAGEAIRGWVPRRADSFEKLNKIGQGTYSNVYRARDLDNDKIVALKKVRFDNLEPESVRFMAREIHILRRLDHPNIVKLEGLVTSRMSCSLYLVFEYMEHDLTGLASFPGVEFTEPQVKCYMQQLLSGLDHCHTNGVLHRDIKGSNLLIDNSGTLKIADFGLASFFDPDQRHALTSRVVTLWYRPPELLLGATNYGVAVDLWSTGCILAELYAGKPIMPGRTEVEQLHKIFKLCGSPTEDYWRKSRLPHATIFKPQQPYKRCVAETFKDFPRPALALIETLLSVDPADRGTAASALTSEFFTMKPLACDPSSLPKYPPSKEFDAKLRDEEARRQGAAGSKVQRLDLEKKGLRESRAIPAPDANAELALSLQKRQAQMNSKSRSEKFNPHQEEVASGFRMEPPRQASVLQVAEDSQGHYSHRSSHSGPLVNRSQWKAMKQEDGAPKVSAVANVAPFSALIAAHKSVISGVGGENIGGQQVVAPVGRLSESGNEHSDSSRKYARYGANGQAGNNQKEDGRNSHTDQPMAYGPKGNKIHYSGPLLRGSGNSDKMLEDHDRQIQEVFRRARIDKSKARRAQGESNQASVKPFDLGAIPVYPSSRGSVPVFSTSRGAVQ